MFKKILIANRGEIACRIIKTAKKLGLQSVAVYSDIDASALHVEMADEAYCLGPATPSQSYLNIEKLIAIALRSDVEAVHPGYGFLSENAQFCHACETAGLKFIGPPVAAIEAMGSKAQAKIIMQSAKVPLVPGYQGDDQSMSTLIKEAGAIGFPVLIKASAGGGGKGMRLVNTEKEFEQALKAAKRESQQSFGDDRVILEKYLQNARHVEVQVFCDTHGNGVYVGDRDCSMQRRHQKIIEEAPAPGLSENLRQAMGEAAVRAALAINYEGAGTVEFLLAQDELFYFMEMNTRLQVEHPVTEMVAGLDLVEWQLRVACGEKLPKQQSALVCTGHAIEARVYAENCNHGFMPSSGTLHYVRWPELTNNVRIDAGIKEGDLVSTYYDPMLAKIIVRGEDRQQAVQFLQNALLESRLGGIETNLPFLSKLVADYAWQSLQFHTAYVDLHLNELVQEAFDEPTLVAKATLAFFMRPDNVASSTNGDPWQATDAWRINLVSRQLLNIGFNGNFCPVQITGNNNAFTVTFADTQLNVEASLGNNILNTVFDGRKESVPIYWRDQNLTMFVGNRAYSFELQSYREQGKTGKNSESAVLAPMHGRLIELAVNKGQQVTEGELVGVVEAMKMEHSLRAPFAGAVSEIFFQVNDVVENGAVIVTIEPTAS